MDSNPYLRSRLLATAISSLPITRRRRPIGPRTVLCRDRRVPGGRRFRQIPLMSVAALAIARQRRHLDSCVIVG